MVEFYVMQIRLGNIDISDVPKIFKKQTEDILKGKKYE